MSKYWFGVAIAASALVAGAVWAQDKVGTTAVVLLEMSPAIRANGMGEAGVALNDPQGWFFNPGILGAAVGDDGITITPWVGAGMPAGIDYTAIGAQVPDWPPVSARCSPIYAAVGYQVVDLDSGPIQELDYTGAPTGRSFSYRAHSHILYGALGFRKGVAVGLGGTAKRMSEQMQNIGSDLWAFDAGVFIRYPLLFLPFDSAAAHYFKIHPAIGLSVTNMGGDVEALLDTYPLPRSLRYGASCPIIYGRHKAFGDWNVVGVTAAVEIENPHHGMDKTKMGIEAGVFEAAYFRAGEISAGLESDKTTWGFTIDSRGLAKLWAVLRSNPAPRSSVLYYLIQRVHVQYAESHAEIESFDDGSTYRGVLIGLRF